MVLILPPGSNMSQYLSHKILPCEGRILLSEALRCLPRIFPQTRSWSSNFRAGKRNHFSFILLNKCSDLDRWHLWVTSTISTQPTTACRPSFTSTWSVSNKMPPLPSQKRCIAISISASISYIEEREKSSELSSWGYGMKVFKRAKSPPFLLADYFQPLNIWIKFG